jgi:hypothetical protein
MIRVAIIALSGILVACGTSDPSGPGSDEDDGSFGARIDGVDWSHAFVSAENDSPGRYSITAGIRGSSDYTLDLFLHNIGGPGTYPLGVSHSVFGGIGQLSQAGSVWVTPHTGVAGQAVITALTETRISGTFEFVAVPHTATVVNKTVTQGVFDLPVTGTGGVAAANQGSSLTATIDGVSLVFPIAGPGVMFGDSLRFGAYSEGYRFVAQVDNMTGVGSYALSGPMSVIMVATPPGTPTAAWSTDATGGSGSVVITSATSGRVMGAFTATLMAVFGTATGPMTISGTFNMGGYF